MTAKGVDKFAAGAEALLTDLSAEAALQLDPKPGRAVLLAPGSQVAYDDCCDGQVWARLVSIEPTPGTDPRRGGGLHPCAVPHFVATVELGVIRCAAVVNDRGQAPSPRQIIADGQQGMKDMATLLGVLRCSENVRGLLSWTPVGPEGGCHGGFWTVTMLLANCIGCSDG